MSKLPRRRLPVAKSTRGTMHIMEFLVPPVATPILRWHLAINESCMPAEAEAEKHDVVHCGFNTSAAGTVKPADPPVVPGRAPETPGQDPYMSLITVTFPLVRGTLYSVLPPS